MNASQQHQRSGFTLLEVLLALGLAVIVMGLVGSALNTTLRLIESGRVRTERDQLARAILAKIADDVRSRVRYEPFDPSGMMKLSPSTATSSSQSGQSGSTGTNGSTGGTGASQTSGGSGGSASASSSNNSSSTNSSSQSSTSSTPAVVSTTITGLVGYDTGLQIDIGRIPRLDEYVASRSNNQTSAPPVSDVRRVMYYLANSASSIVSSTGTNGTSGTGLVRSELNHASAQYTADTGGDATSESNGAVVAPEVLALEFSYFDGSEWISAWDTTSYNGLPQLIKISIALTDPARSKSAPAQSFSSIADAAEQDPDNVYSVVVRVPACDPIPSVSGSSSSSGSSTSTSGSSGTSGSTGATGGGSTTSAN